MNLDLFEQKNYKDRTQDIPVPELSEFFDDGETETWTVRGATGLEVAAANNSVESSRNMEEIIAAIASGTPKEKLNVVKDALGMPTNKVPTDMIRRYEMLTICSVSPKCPKRIAIRLAMNFPTTFYKLTNAIIALTGKGRVGE